MDDEQHRVASLTQAEKDVLRAFLTASDVKEIARRIGRTPPTVEQRLARARRRLGVRRSLDAALMLARVEGNPIYGSAIYGPDTPAAVAEDTGNSGEPATDNAAPATLPFPTRGRPWNALPAWRRIGWIVVGLAALTICAVLTTDVLETASRIARLQH